MDDPVFPLIVGGIVQDVDDACLGQAHQIREVAALLVNRARHIERRAKDTAKARERAWTLD